VFLETFIVQIMALRVMSDSDSEYGWLLIIQTPLSYKLNPTNVGTVGMGKIIAQKWKLLG
jgi:hypothetical protein